MATADKVSHYLSWIAVSTTLASILSAGTVYFGGVEDTRGTTIEGIGDYNDLVFSLSGNAVINAPGGVFANLSPGSVNQGGGIFWDHPSLDGANKNIGYCLTGTGSCQNVAGSYPSLEDLATSTGGSVNDVTFTSTGPVSVDLLSKITANAGSNVLGWYDPLNPSVLHPLFNGADALGSSTTFNPSATFALYLIGPNAVFGSISANNIGESAFQQHFAFFQTVSGSTGSGSTGSGSTGSGSTGSGSTGSGSTGSGSTGSGPPGAGPPVDPGGPGSPLSPFLVGGSVAATTVPEPGTGCALALGLAALGIAALARSKFCTAA